MEQPTGEVWPIEDVRLVSSARLREWQRIVALLDVNRADVERETRQRATIQEHLGRWVRFLAVTAATLFALHAAWQTSDLTNWFEFWVLAAVMLFFCFRLLPAALRKPAFDLRGIVLDLCDAAASAVDSIAPRSRNQPAVLDDASCPPNEMVLRPLYRAVAVLSWGNLAIAVGMGIVIGIEFACSQGLLSLFRSTGWNVDWLWISVVLLTFFSPAFELFRLIRPFAAVVDETGLAWRESGNRLRIDWQDIRSVCVLYLPEVSIPYLRPPRRIYLIDAGSATFLWTPTLSGRHKQRGGDSSWLLCRLVVTRTGLPLRDLSSGVARIIEEQSRGTTRTTWSEVRASLIGNATTRREQRVRLARAIAPFAISILLVTCLIVTGIGVLKLQPGAYTNQLAIARSSTPLLRDPLSRDTGLWPVSADGRQAFTDGAYALHTDDESAVTVWTSRAFGDVMLEMTMRHTTGSDLNIAGIILRADDARQTMLVFAVTPNGEWQLYRLPMVSPDDLDNGQELANGNSVFSVTALHQGLDATNRLSVIMRGNSYALFINDQYIVTYHDDGGPRAGHLGMYVDGYSGTAAYTDLSVYPAPPASLLAPV